MDGTVRIGREVLLELSNQAQGEPALECCGLLAGRDGVITHAFPAENVASDPYKTYEIAPEAIFRLMREFRVRRLEFLGIYHSHPNGENQPSARDIELAYYSDEVYIVLTPRRDAARSVRAFSIRDGRARELEIQTV
jgi:proteasome lid subunit RPN8/RPN11